MNHFLLRFYILHLYCLNNKIEEKNDIYFSSLANDINNISEGLENSIEQRIKSERMKSELITNVSHDLKTPLTSIINYVELIKKEENIQPFKRLCESA